MMGVGNQLCVPEMVCALSKYKIYYYYVFFKRQERNQLLRDFVQTLFWLR